MDDLLRRWQHGWGLCRGLGPAVVRPEALDVVLDLPGRHRELFTRHPAAATDLAKEASRSARPTWLTVTVTTPAAADEAAAVLRSAGLDVFAERRALMTADLSPAAVDTPYPVELTTAGPLERVRLGRDAARGMVAITGCDAVFHDIHTDPDHRRRGLGTAVMGLLTNRAIERNATTGLLMATAEGAQLYRALGWTTRAITVTAAPPAAEAASPPLAV